MRMRWTGEGKPFGRKGLSIPQGIPTNVRNCWEVRQANRAARHLKLPDRREHGLQRRLPAVATRVAGWGLKLGASSGQDASSESRSIFRSFLVFLRLSSSSHLTGEISPLELHHLVPVHIPNLLVPSASQTRTAFRSLGLGSSTACGGMPVSFIQGAKRESRGTVKRSCLGFKGDFRQWEDLLRVGD